MVLPTGCIYTHCNDIFRLQSKSVSRHPTLTNKSEFHDVYICPKGTEPSFPLCICASCGSSVYHPKGAYSGPLVIMLGIKRDLGILHHFFFLK